MNPRNEGLSPPALARLGGLLYLIVILAGLFCEVLARGSLVVSGDAVATANHLRASEGLWRAGVAIDLVACACTVGLAWILFGLLRVVDRNLALLTLCFDVIAIGLQAAFELNLVAALFPLGSAAYLKAFTPAQLDTLAYLSIRSHTFGFGISLLFFGLAFPIRGYLIARSGFLPRAVGVLVTIAGLGYMANGFALVLVPAFAGKLFLFVAAPILAGEGSLCLWLLVKGVDVERWRLRGTREEMHA